jgi:hypothetical protein
LSAVSITVEPGQLVAIIAVGYLPQDDIIHSELPLATTLCYAARVRLPAATSATWAVLAAKARRGTA